MGFMLTRPSVEWTGWSGVWDAIWYTGKIDEDGVLRDSVTAGTIWRNAKGGFTAERPSGDCLFVRNFGEAVDKLAMPFYGGRSTMSTFKVGDKVLIRPIDGEEPMIAEVVPSVDNQYELAVVFVGYEEHGAYGFDEFEVEACDFEVRKIDD